MKFNLQLGLIGLLFIAGAAQATTLEQVKASLATVLPEGDIVDETAKDCIGNLNKSNPLWLSIYINSLLRAKKDTQNCNSYAGFAGWLPYVKTLAADHTTNTATKLVIIKENGGIVCGIKFTITGDKHTANYLQPDAVNALVKNGCVQTERGFTSFYQVPESYRGPLYTTAKVIAYSAAAYGAYRFGSWYLNHLRTTIKAETMEYVQKNFRTLFADQLKAAQEAAVQAVKDAPQQAAHVVVAAGNASAPKSGNGSIFG